MFQIDIAEQLKFKASEISVLWKDKARRSDNLKRCAQLTDEQLISINLDVYPALAGWIDGASDKNAIGAFFVSQGKARCIQEFSVSEAIFSLVLSQKAVIEFIFSENSPENAMELYRSVEVTSRISEFFMLGSFYLTKGFLEEAYTGLVRESGIPEATLKKFLNDDFFFKDDHL